MTENSLRKEIIKVLHQNRDNPGLKLLHRLRRPPHAPGNVPGNAPLKEMLIEAKVGQIFRGKKQLLFMLGAVERGKTAIAGGMLEASGILNRHFGLNTDCYLAWEDDQQRVKELGLVDPSLTSGPKNSPGHYGDSDYIVFNVHYDSTLRTATSQSDFVVSDCAHLVGRGELAFQRFTDPQIKSTDSLTETNGVYVSAMRDIPSYSTRLREAALRYPDLVDEIVKGENIPIPQGSYKIRGGGWDATLEYTKLENDYFFDLVKKGFLDYPDLRNPNQLFDPNFHARFVEQAYTHYLFQQSPLDRFTVIRNRFICDRWGHSIIPAGYPIIEECSVY